MSEPSARAANAISRHLPKDALPVGRKVSLVDEMSEIINRETGLPELLERLEEMVAYVAEHPHLLEGDEDTWERVWFDNARAAIAKAKGEA